MADDDSTKDKTCGEEKKKKKKTKHCRSISKQRSRRNVSETTQPTKKRTDDKAIKEKKRSSRKASTPKRGKRHPQQPEETPKQQRQPSRSRSRPTHQVGEHVNWNDVVLAAIYQPGGPGVSDKGASLLANQRQTLSHEYFQDAPSQVLQSPATYDSCSSSFTSSFSSSSSPSLNAHQAYHSPPPSSSSKDKHKNHCRPSPTSVMRFDDNNDDKEALNASRHKETKTTKSAKKSRKRHPPPPPPPLTSQDKEEEESRVYDRITAKYLADCNDRLTTKLDDKNPKDDFERTTQTTDVVTREERQRQVAFEFYRTHGRPGRREMKELVVARMMLGITERDVDLLPWAKGGFVVDERKLLHPKLLTKGRSKRQLSKRRLLREEEVDRKDWV